MPRRRPTSAPVQETPVQGGDLHRRAWRRFLRGPDPLLLEDLYVPALAEAVRYDRCCSYFSSTVLAAAARGFGRLIERLEAMGEEAPRPAVRLVVNEELVPEDVRAMTETGDVTRLEVLLKRRFKSPADALARKRLAMLGWLVKCGLLEVRVGVMRHGTGIVHAKFGVVTDASGSAVVFSGSGNESAAGLLANHERLEVSTSWEDPDRHREYAGEFAQLWGNTHPDVHTVPLPEALRLKLVKFAPRDPPIVEPSNALVRQRAAMIWSFIVESPYTPDGGAACDATAIVDLWPHQRRVVEEAAEAWPEGRLLCDEVGMGKTIEAILILRRLMAGRGVRRALILVPAGLVKQWQGELREKGGMVVPRLEGTTQLVWPDERMEKVDGLAAALKRDVLLMSRETARTDTNLPVLLASRPWDLVVLDESHAARRRRQEEGEFNGATLLLELLRQLQLRRGTRGFLLLSATPMQTHPWEPWDLLAVLGEGGAWLADFGGVRDFYRAVAAAQAGRCGIETARRAASLIASDPGFPAPPGGRPASGGADEVMRKIAFAPPGRRAEIARWLRRGTPLGRRMHRNTRGALRRYFEMGLLPAPPPRRDVQDVVFNYEEAAERRVYQAVGDYIEKRFRELEEERSGKGFVMTVYRRRASSSPLAIQRSLERRCRGLQRIVQARAADLDLDRADVPEALDTEELPEDFGGKIPAALPQDPQVARRELLELEGVLDQVHQLRGRDTKRDRFFEILRRITEDGRPVLIFTEYTDTLEYLRDHLVEYYGTTLGCYSGDGGLRWDGNTWKAVTKDTITSALQAGELRTLLCTDAASEGLNLQAAGAVINYDLPWNPSKVEQRIGRIDRIGQALGEIRIVNVFLKDSVDDKVYGALRRRCGLFEHFVGAMQPVLARARRMLTGHEDVDPHGLESAAEEVERDPLAGETYLESEAEGGTAPAPAVERTDMETALKLLSAEFGVQVKPHREAGRHEIKAADFPRTIFASKTVALEHDRALVPLSPLEPRLRQLAEMLSRPGERLPLVIGTYQKDGFRVAVPYWVGGGEATRVSSLPELREKVDAWDGRYPEPGGWVRAESVAQREAQRRVRLLEQRAEQREREGLRRQLSAARLRLLRELGRYLACLDATSGDFNALLHQQMTRDIASAQRLKQALEKLGGYPDWPAEIRQDLVEFTALLTENQRRARLLGKELDAALEDPRWRAAQSG